MALRYPLAAVIAYLMFLGLLRLWAQYQLKSGHLPAEDDPASVETVSEPPESPWKETVSNLLDVVSWFSDFEIFFVIFAIVGIVIAIVGIMVAAPILLAEVLLDALLVAGLWRRFKRQGVESTLGTAARATILPAAVVMVCLLVIGLLLGTIDPSADSIGDLFR